MKIENPMTVVVLPPHVWTEVDANMVQPKEQTQLRVATYLCQHQDGLAGIKRIPPENDTEAYFLTPGYDGKPVLTADYIRWHGNALNSPASVFLMPHGNDAVTVVLLNGGAI